MQARSRALRDRGELVAGKYLLERPLAEGGMGSLWVARHVELDIEIAIKFSAMGRGESHDARFRREARATARLKSPHIVQVFDYGIDRDEPYIAMELLEGESLRELLDRERRLPLERVAVFVEEIAKGLSLAHEAGIVHRDLKPSNLFLARASRELVLKIVDFGIAKASAEPALPTSSIASSLAGDVTRVGAVVGSPGYMSPEQAQGAPVDHRSDLWSLALVAFRMLSGSEPFLGADTAEIVGKIRAAPIPRISRLAPELPAELDAFFDRALARPREDRFQSAEELASQLSAIAARYTNVETTPAATASPATRPHPDSVVGRTGVTRALELAATSRWRRRRAVPILAAVLALGLGSILALLLWSDNRVPHAAVSGGSRGREPTSDEPAERHVSAQASEPALAVPLPSASEQAAAPQALARATRNAPPARGPSAGWGGAAASEASPAVSADEVDPVFGLLR